MVPAQVCSPAVLSYLVSIPSLSRSEALSDSPVPISSNANTSAEESGFFSVGDAIMIEQFYLLTRLFSDLYFYKKKFVVRAEPRSL